MNSAMDSLTGEHFTVWQIVKGSRLFGRLRGGCFGMKHRIIALFKMEGVTFA